MTAYLLNHICYPDAQSAYDAWREQFPTPPDGAGNIWFMNGANVDVNTGLITGSLKNGLNGATVNLTALQLRPCQGQNATYIFDKMPTQDMLFAAVLVVAFILGFGQGKAV